MVYVETFAYGVGVVVVASGDFAALDEACGEYIVGDFESDHRVDFLAAFFEHFAEGVGLWNCAWESVEYESFG